MTQAMWQGLRALLAELTRVVSGGQIVRTADLPSGTVTPILARSENAEILTARVEGVVPPQVSPQHHESYAFALDGSECARQELARIYHVSLTSPGRYEPGLGGG